MCFAGIEDEIRSLPRKPGAPEPVPAADEPEPPTVRAPTGGELDGPTVPAPSIEHPRAA